MITWHRTHATALAVFLFSVTISPVANGQVQQRPNEGSPWWEMIPPFIIRPPQRPQNGRFRLLRFSPDGRYVLAQDDSGITVLSVQPFAVLFHHFAEEVLSAGFTPDSQQVWFVNRPAHRITPQLVFSGSDSYVELWSIAHRMCLEVKEIPLRACVSWNLSPDSRVLACVDTGRTLRLIEVGTGNTIFEKKKFGRTLIIQDASAETIFRSDDVGRARIDFSCDGRFVIATPTGVDGSTIAWDFRERAQVRLSGGLRKLGRL
jgi:hypothetical protein